MRWALIEAGRVANVVEQDVQPTIAGEWVACGNAGPGWAYNGTFSDPNAVAVPSWSDPALDPRYHWVDVGPFFDRFGAKALSVTGSTDPQVQGLVTLLLPRKYVDLKRVDLPSMLDLLISKGLIDGADKAAVLNPVTSDYERHVKGLAQPV
jgi:hypothetical protein